MNGVHAELDTLAVADILVWDAHLETGIAELDEQHCELVRLINRMGRVQMTEQGEGAFARALLAVLDELAAYVEYHFGFEEAYIGRYYSNADHSASHRQGHGDFMRRMAEARDAALGYPGSVASRMLSFLSRWLITHIIGTDMHMARKILAMQSGMTEPEATRAADAAMGDTSAHLLASMDRLYECLSRRTHDLVELKHRHNQEIARRRAAEEDLRKLWRAMEHSPMAVIITNAAGEFEYVNPKFSELTGYSAEEVAGRTPRILKSGQTPDDKYRQMWEAISSGREWRGELSNRTKGGELYWENVAISPVLGGDGAVTHYVAMQENITARKAVEEALCAQKQFADEIINSLPGIFYMLDEAGGFVRVNRQFSAVSGYAAEDLSRMSALDFFEGNDRALVARRVREALVRGSARCQAEFVIRSGRKIPYDFTGLRAHIDGKCYLVGLGTDMTERRELERELARQACTDFLTGVYNRRHFMALAEQELARSLRYGTQVSVLMLDLDRFKHINDEYGHATGDRALCAIAGVCRAALRENDIFGRLGGEEFAVVLPETDALQAVETAERLRSEIARHRLALEDGSTLHMTVSIGIAARRRGDIGIDKLMNRADHAMYVAKRAGRNRVIVGCDE